MDQIATAGTVGTVPSPRRGQEIQRRRAGGEGRSEFTDHGGLPIFRAAVPAVDTSPGLVRSICRCVLTIWRQKEQERYRRIEPFLPTVDSTLELITDEIVTNAVQQERRTRLAASESTSDANSASSMILVTWRLAPQVIYIEVRGGCRDVSSGGDDPSVPTLVESDDFEDVSDDVVKLDKILDLLAESGRGLMLVDSLSRDWGWYRTDEGELAVWSVIDR